MSLLPQGALRAPGMSLAALCAPAREVGGDYYDFLPLADGRVGLLIADVSGKGTSAALYMAELKGLMLSLTRIHTSPRALLIEANEIIKYHLDSRSFITMTYAVVDIAARTLTSQLYDVQTRDPWVFGIATAALLLTAAVAAALPARRAARLTARGVIERLKDLIAPFWPKLRLRVILFGVLLFAAAMPAIGAISLRVFENTLVRQTEAELVAQGAALAAVASVDWPGAPPPIPRPVKPPDGYYRPESTTIDLSRGPVLGERPPRVAVKQDSGPPAGVSRMGEGPIA